MEKMFNFLFVVVGYLNVFDVMNFIKVRLLKFSEIFCIYDVICMFILYVKLGCSDEMSFFLLFKCL